MDFVSSIAIALVRCFSFFLAASGCLFDNLDILPTKHACHVLSGNSCLALQDGRN